MQLRLLFTVASAALCACVHAQNTSPYWSLAGNSNTTSASKIGTTNVMPLRLVTSNKTQLYISPSAGYIGMGTTAPNSKLHITAPAGINAFRIQEGGATKMLVHSNGGTAIGANVTPPANGLYVADTVKVNGTIYVNTPTPTYEPLQYGVYAQGDYAVKAIGDFVGVYGRGTADYGVMGEGRTGVRGVGDVGVEGRGVVSGTGVVGSAEFGIGVLGITYEEDCIGVVGQGDMYIGVQGISKNHIGVYGYTTNASSYAGYFNGNVFTTGAYLPSARKLKHNISDLNSAMLVISKLLPKEYEYKQDANYKLLNLPQGKHYGLVAEEVEEVLPGLIKATEFYTRDVQRRDTMGKLEPATKPFEKIEFKAVNYTELIPIIIKGMQEQEAENKALKAEIEALRPLKDEVAELRQMVLELKVGRNNTVTSNIGSLEQNTPNPVSGATIIRYNVPESSTSARLTLTNAKGQVVKTMTLNNRGAGQVNLNIQNLASGTYHYTLYVDGRVIETKRLIIAK